MSELPMGWVEVDMNAILKNISLTHKKIKIKQCLENGRFPVIDQSKQTVSGFYDDEDFVINQDNDCLIIFGDHTRCVKWVDFPFIAGADGIKVLKPHDLLNSRFLYHHICAIDLKDRGYGRHFGLLQQSTFSLPSKAEQDHIATLLDNHLSQVATIRQKLNDILPIIKQFRQSVLAQAVSGRLTEDWREHNKNFFAKDDYEHYLNSENQKDKTIKEKIKLRQDKKFQIESHPIESWITLPFFELSLLNRGFDLPASQRIEGEYPIISSSGHSGMHNQFTVKAPCITVGRSGSVGRVFYHNQDCWALNTALYVKSFGFSDPKFIYWKLVSMDLAQYSSSTAVPTLNRNEFMFEPVDVPPLAEQQQIVTEVERLFALADSIETQVKEALERVGHLMQSILHQAFMGNLSADWRACNADLITGEHSATALLAQIKQAEPKSPRKKKTQ